MLSIGTENGVAAMKNNTEVSQNVERGKSYHM